MEKFLIAQEEIYFRALDEIKKGKKQTHWMWFIFPQLAGLGQSEMSIFYGIKGIEEAKDYLAHPLLGSRLIEISAALLQHKGVSSRVIMGDIDSMKLRSSMTLFACVSEDDSIFHKVINVFFKGCMCQKTLKLLEVE